VIGAAWICLVAPLAAALLITLLGTGISRRTAAYISTTSVLGAFAAAVVVFAKLWGEAPSARSHPSTAWEWLTAGSFHVGLRILVDPLSVFMMLIVSGVGFLIVAYSIGYMDGDDEERRYFAYMALFVFSMLLLVQAGNLVLLLAGWGLVGLSSYLLIGFWHDRPSAVAAAKKAFIMNAVGDATMALAFFLLIQHRQTLNFPDAFAVGPGHGWLVNLVALGLLGGAVAKSAQLPLQTWLPDAMEGPTPVSALIHAATMVTAGVYLIVRTHAVFEQAPRVQELAAGLGAGTLLMAGLIALVQTDIKRVIAYSTMSQIGYMFLGAGLGAYANAEFHLMTHAFFKALLFMAAGLVIHALAGEQDIRKMGGVGRLMPVTRLTFLVGSLALVGMPPFSGFFSKDSIIAAAMSRGWYGYILFAAALIGTFLTGLYAFRLFLIVFPGEPSAFVREHLMRGSHAAGMEGAHDVSGDLGPGPGPPGHDVHEHAGEGPFSMTATVAVLAVLAVVGGWIQFAPLWHPVSDWLDPVARPLAVPTNTQEALASLFAFLLGLAGIGVAWLIYGTRRWRVPRLALAQRVLEHKLYFDEVYDFAFYRPAVSLAKVLGRWIEGPIIGGSIKEIAGAFREAGLDTSRLQTGLVRTYALAIAASLAVITIVFVAVR
jgi:NADH-quinone oxidoreductase subunit L